MTAFDPPEIRAVHVPEADDDTYGSWGYIDARTGRRKYQGVPSEYRPLSDEGYHAWRQDRMYALLTGKPGLFIWPLWLEAQEIGNEINRQLREIDDECEAISARWGWYSREIMPGHEWGTTEQGYQHQPNPMQRWSFRYWRMVDTPEAVRFNADMVRSIELGHRRQTIARGRSFSHGYNPNPDFVTLLRKTPIPEGLGLGSDLGLIYLVYTEFIDLFYRTFPEGHGHELEFARFEWPESARRITEARRARRAEAANPPDDWARRLERVKVGGIAGGGSWYVRVLGTHLLVAGIAGAGKGSVVWSLVAGLAEAVKAGVVELWGMDPKRVELSFGRGVWKRYADTPEAIVTAMEDAVADMHRRNDELQGRARKTAVTTDEPVRVIVVDELGFMSALVPDRDLKRRFTAALDTMLVLGRATGYVVVGCLQDPRKETLPSRDLWPTKVAMRLTKEMVVLVLGRDAYEQGARCDQFTVDDAGSAFVHSEEDPGALLQVRAFWVSDVKIKELEAELMPYVSGERSPE